MTEPVDHFIKRHLRGHRTRFGDDEYPGPVLDYHPAPQEGPRVSREGVSAIRRRYVNPKKPKKSDTS